MSQKVRAKPEPEFSSMVLYTAVGAIDFGGVLR